MGLDPNDNVILTVAENQERKNPAAAMQAVALFKKNNPDIKFHYIMVSTEYHPYKHNMGNRLNELAQDLGLANEFILYDKGMSNEQLVLLYQMSDTFLLSSKAEGLGLPILEAMACGLQVVATDTGALRELLQGGRGYLVEPAYTMTDVWMNSKRDFIDVELAAKCLYLSLMETLSGGREYVESLNGKGQAVILNAVEVLCEQK